MASPGKLLLVIKIKCLRAVIEEENCGYTKLMPKLPLAVFVCIYGCVCVCIYGCVCVCAVLCVSGKSAPQGSRLKKS